MKKLLYLLILTMSAALVSCEDKATEITVEQNSSTDQSNENKDSITVNLRGDVAVSKAQVHDGDTITLSLINIEGLDVLYTEDYKNKSEYTIEAEYFVDDKSVGKTSDMSNGFALEYNVKGLETGVHNVSVSCMGGSKIILSANISQNSFTVLEETNDPDQPDESDGVVTVNLKGDVALNKEQVYEGDMLTISLVITEGLDALNKEDYRNKAEYSIEVEYFVDNKSVGKTSDMSNGFALDYNVKGLANGVHYVSASCKGGSKLQLTTSIAQNSFTILENSKNEGVKVSFGAYFNMSTDLFEFVTPIVSYTDSHGEHKSEITPEMCEDESFSVNNITYAYKTRRWDIEANLIPGQTYKVILNYVPKGSVSADPDKRYYCQTGLNINKYSYTYNGNIYIGNIVNVNLDFNINIGKDQNEPDDGLLSGKNVDEYIKQLCASTKSIDIVLDQDGKLSVK